MFLLFPIASYGAISGPSSVTGGNTYTYTINNAVVYADGFWSATNGTIISESQSGSTYTGVIQWSSTLTSGTLKFKNGPVTTIATLSITISPPPPADPVTTFSATYTCGGATVTRISSPASGVEWYWQSSSTGTSTSNNSNNATFSYGSSLYLRARQTASPNTWSTGSLSPGITIGNPLPLPGNPQNVTGGSRCGSGAVTLSADLGSNASGGEVHWYTSNVYAGSGATFTPSVSSTTIYKAYSYNPANHCESQDPGVSATATIYSAPGTPTISGNKRFTSGALNLNAYLAAGGTYKWYDPSNNLLLTGSDYTTPSVSSSTSNYGYVTVTNALGCVGAAAWFDVSIFALPVITASHSVIIKGATETLTSTSGFDTYSWANSASVSQGSAISMSTAIADTYRLIVTKSGLTAPGVFATLSTPLSGVDMNYIISNTLQVENITTVNDVYSAPSETALQTVQYFDGLGRPVQSVLTQASPLKQDIIQPTVYDEYGRANRKYLPFVNGNDGLYKIDVIDGSGNYVNGALNFYNNPADKIADDTRYFAETLFESSPLNRPLKQFGTGADWYTNNKSVEQAFPINKDGTGSGQEKIIIWTISSSGMPVRLTSLNSGYYASGSLFIKSTKDENGHEVREYSDKDGNMILKKIYVTGSGLDFTSPGYWAETDYIYDDSGKRRYVLQPELCKTLAGSATANPSGADLSKFAFQYKYDARLRLVEKKVSGAGTNYIVYDQLDRVVLTQDSLQRPKKQWSFVKYDDRNRPVMTGIYTHTAVESQAAMTSHISTTSFFEQINVSATHGYTTDILFPSTNLDILTVTYYDGYGYVQSNWGAAYNYVNDGLTSGVYSQPSAFLLTNGSVTGTKIKTLDNSDTWLRTINYYDEKSRLIQTISNNYKGGTDRISILYDFPGKVLKTITIHTLGSATNSITIRRNYDHAGRALNTWHKINNGSEILLTRNSYNEIGQLVEKNLHSTDGTHFKQSIDYSYTIRGWMNKINQGDVSTIAGNDQHKDYFGMELAYTNTFAGITSTANFSGNISAVKWAAAGNKQQAYVYDYDNMNRILNADHLDYDSVSSWASHSRGFSERGISYDLNGNITSLKRKGYQGESMDNLTYGYNGNQLSFVHDAESATAGFVNGNTGTDDYDYDANGNLSQDKNKSITTNGIQYNHLNLVRKVYKSGSDSIIYTYDAVGRKLRQQVYGSHVKVTDYVGEMIYENDTLKVMQQDEGRVIPDGAAWEYQYFLKDHLGNVRVAFTAKAQTPDVYTATLEDNTQTSEQANFHNYSRSNFDLYDHTDAGTTYTYSQLLNGGLNSQIGLSRSFPVMAGDTIKAEVYAKYEGTTGGTSNLTGFAAALLSAFGLSTPGIGETGTAASAINSYGTVIAGSGSSGEAGRPKGWLTMLVFDKDYHLVDFAFQQLNSTYVQTGSTKMPFDLLSKQVNIKQAGYVYIYVSNEGAMQQNIYFDDFKITQIKSPVIQTNDYYGFGLAFNSYQREQTMPNLLHYNGKEMQDEMDLNWGDHGFRMYQSEIGRWFAVDALAEKHRALSPYAFVLNNPLLFSDPFGLDTLNEVVVTARRLEVSPNWTTFIQSIGAQGYEDFINVLFQSKLDKYRTPFAASIYGRNENGEVAIPDDIMDQEYEEAEDEALPTLAAMWAMEESGEDPSSIGFVFNPFAQANFNIVYVQTGVTTEEGKSLVTGIGLQVAISWIGSSVIKSPNEFFVNKTKTGGRTIFQNIRDRGKNFRVDYDKANKVHYHRRGNGPGQGIGRHRPYEKKSTDKWFMDRF